MKRKNHLMFYLTLLICAIMPLGFASFDILAGETSQAKPTLDDAVTKICYNDTTNKQYTTIEMALKEANSGETIYVFPNPDGVSIYNDCVIKEGVTLNLPYSITYDASTNTYNPISFASTSGSPGNLTYNTSYRESLLYIEEGVTLTNNGTLYVGGKQTGGSGGLAFAGQTYQSFSEINVKKNASIVSNGNLISYGYIRGITEVDDTTGEVNSLSNIYLNSTSVTELPFIVVEHRGGSFFMGMAAKDNSELSDIVTSMISLSPSTAPRYADAKLQTAPFNRFLICNFLDLNYTFYSGSKLICNADLYADGKNNQASINMIGYGDQSYFLQFTSEQTILKGWVNSQTLKNSLTIYGSFKINSLSLSLYIDKSASKAGVTAYIKGYINLSTTQIHFPISHYFDISLKPFLNGNSSTADLTSQKIKLLPGSNVFVDHNVTINADSLAVYKNEYFYPQGNYYITGNVGCSLKYPDTDDANFICNGFLNANSFSGIIKRSALSDTSFLNISESNNIVIKEISNSITTNLVVSYMGLELTVTQYMASLYNELSITANGYSSLVYGKDFSNLYTNTPYKVALVDGEFVYYSYTISYVNVLDENLIESNYQFINNNNLFFVPNDTAQLSQLSYNKINGDAPDINFLGFFLDYECTISVSKLDLLTIKDFVNNDNIIIYCKWQKMTNGISVIIENVDGTQYDYKEYEDTTAEINNLPTNFSKTSLIEGTFNIDNQIKITNYVFDGWEIINGTTDEQKTTLGVVSSANIIAEAGSIVTLKPIFSTDTSEYNKIFIKFTCISQGFWPLYAKTSGSVTISNFIDNDSYVINTNSTTFNFEDNDSEKIIYAPKGTGIKIDYSGADFGIYSAEVQVSFSGFTDNTTIPKTTSSGSTTRYTNSTYCQIIIN